MEKGKSLTTIIFGYIITVLIYAGVIWAVANIFTKAFNIACYFTYIQSTAITLVLIVLGTILRASTARD